MGCSNNEMCVNCYLLCTYQWRTKKLFFSLERSPPSFLSRPLIFFLICAEGFSSLLYKAENEGSIQGVAVSRHSPRVSHFFFADDSLLFTRATIHSCSTVADIHLVYVEASGQCINATKSTIFFSPNTKVKVEFKRI